MFRKKNRSSRTPLTDVTLTLYGNVQLVRGYCEKCKSNSIIQRGRFLCCNSQVSGNPKTQYRESQTVIKVKTEEIKQREKFNHGTRLERMEQNGGAHTNKEWQDLCKKYGYACLCCGERKPLTEDHIIPVVLGGSDDITNIQPLCLECNCKKSGKFIDFRPRFD